jgi:hypothetical protein
MAAALVGLMFWNYANALKSQQSISQDVLRKEFACSTNG